MLRLLQHEELDGLLLEAPDVLAGFRARRPDFEQVADDWMGRVEQALRNTRLPLCSTVAATRAQLLAERGARPGPAQTSRRAARAGRAVSAVKRVVEDLDGELGRTRRRFDDAGDVARNVLAIAEATGTLAPAAGRDATSPRQLFQLLQQNSHTAGGLVQLTGLVGYQDALIVLSRRLVDLPDS